MEEAVLSKAVVIGSGVMGQGIAAALATAGVRVVLLDIIPPNGLTEEEKASGLSESSPAWRNKIAETGLKRAISAKPPLFYDLADAKLITAGNVEDNIDEAAGADWIIEAVPEVVAIKRKLYAELEKHLKPGCAITSNTSGILLDELMEGRSDLFVRQFFITHFFNPVRYMKLLEIVSHDKADADIVNKIIAFSQKTLGKGIVIAKNTPGFVANRIGIQALGHASQLAVEMNIPPETADYLTGSLIGRANSGTLRTIDIVGIDTLAFASDHLYESLAYDPRRGECKLPGITPAMVEKKLWGGKTGAGYYKMEKTPDGGRNLLSLDYTALTYKPQIAPSFPWSAEAEKIKKLGEKLRFIFAQSDEGAAYVRKTVTAYLTYAAEKIPEIADRIYMVDDAMRWGYNYSAGPFELWDELGVEYIAGLLKAEGASVPPLVESLLTSGNKTFYIVKDGERLDFDPASRTYKEKLIAQSKLSAAKIKTEKGAHLLDTPDACMAYAGDGVNVLLLKSKTGYLSDGALEAIEKAVAASEESGCALVISSDGRAFSTGENVPALLEAAQTGGRDAVEGCVQRLQRAAQAVKYAKVPTVAAVFGACAGAGAELALCASVVVAHIDAQIGFNQTFSGFIPAAGGMLRLFENFEKELSAAGPGPIAEKIFELTLFSKVAGNAKEAFKLGYLTSGGKLCRNLDSLLDEAKDAAIELKTGGFEPRKPRDYRLSGEGGAAVLTEKAAQWERDKAATPHDAVIGKALAKALCGGNIGSNTAISEAQALDIERQIFVELLQNENSVKRMEAIAVKGKPLRN